MKTAQIIALLLAGIALSSAIQAGCSTTDAAPTILPIKSAKTPSSTQSPVSQEYTSNSEPDAVTGKKLRLENSSYLFFKNNKLAMLRMWAPQGADNVDQWRRISRSFRWL